MLILFVRLMILLLLFLWFLYVVSNYENDSKKTKYSRKSGKIIRMRIELCILFFLLFIVLKSIILIGSCISITIISFIAIKLDNNEKKWNEHQILKVYLNYLVLILMTYCVIKPMSLTLNSVFENLFLIKLLLGIVLNIPLDYMYKEKLKDFIKKVKLNLGARP